MPVRCFSCGKPIAHLWDDYKKRTADGESQKAVLDDMGIDKFCCRKAFLGQADTIELISKFKKA